MSAYPTRRKADAMSGDIQIQQISENGGCEYEVKHGVGSGLGMWRK